MELLKKLCGACAPSGHEKAVHSIIKAELEGYADETETDALGNLIVHKRGDGKRLMLAAHADEIGIIVTYIEENGYVRFQNVGGVRPLYALAQRVQFENGTVGTVFYDHGTDIEKITFNDMYIDIGAANVNEAGKFVSIGDCAGFVGEYVQQGDVVISKSLDDRAGCYVLIEAVKRAAKSQNDVYAVFTSQEELGVRGATASAYSVSPDVGIAIDVTDTGDTIGAKPMNVSLGGGAAIKIKDSRSISSPYVTNKLKRLAENNGIKYQLEVLLASGTDAGAIQQSKSGVAAATISVPTRYIHSPNEMVNKNDLEACIELVRCVIENEL